MKGGKIGYAKTSTCIVDFARGNWLYRNISGGGGGFYYIAMFSMGNSTMEKS